MADVQMLPLQRRTSEIGNTANLSVRFVVFFVSVALLGGSLEFLKMAVSSNSNTAATMKSNLRRRGDLYIPSVLHIQMFMKKKHVD